jgi:Domain of unknown function (DUF4388)
VIQMLGPARQTGALHINATDADGIIFFEAGEIVHAECDALFGDEAVKEIIQTCQGAEKGVYKFVYGTTAAQRTVLRSATDLLLDAMREMDEEQNASQEENQRDGQHEGQHDGQHDGLHENAEKELS